MHIKKSIRNKLKPTKSGNLRVKERSESRREGRRDSHLQPQSPTETEKAWLLAAQLV